MSFNRRFVDRYAKIQKGLQEREEMALAEAMHAREAALEQLQQSEVHKQQAQMIRNQCRTASDLQMWHAYIQALELQVTASQTQVVDADARVMSQRETVGKAYREAKRWDMMAQKYHRAYQEQLQKDSQIEADEMASRRAGRG